MPKKATTIREVDLRNFSGGINTRDAASELAEDEFPLSMNVTIDERGSVTKRLGYQRRFASAVGTGLVSNMFWWGSKGWLISQIGTGMHKDNAAAFHTWTTNARVGMCEFGGYLAMIHPVDGVRLYDGTTVTGPFTNAPVGNTIAAWQNKLWAAGDPGNPSRVRWSAAGTPGTWNVGDFNDLREKDSALITCLTGASGIDVSGRPGLLVFKQESSYRIYDSATGAYNTIDASMGCASNIGAVSVYGLTVVANTRGLFMTNGLEALTEVSGKVENFFHKDQINQSRPDLFAAGRYQDSLFFSFPRAGATANGIVLEFNPIAKWIVPHTNAASCYASILRDTNDLVMGSPSVNGMIYNSHKTGGDDGTAITSSFQGSWHEPSYGNKVRIRRMRVVGFGTFQISLYKDYETDASFATRTVDIDPNVAIYDVDLYDDPDSIYAPGFFHGHQDFWSIGVVRSFSIRVDETSTNTQSGLSIFGGATAPEKGAWTLSSVKLMEIPLGNV